MLHFGASHVALGELEHFFGKQLQNDHIVAAQRLGGLWSATNIYNYYVINCNFGCFCVILSKKVNNFLISKEIVWIWLFQDNSDEIQNPFGFQTILMKIETNLPWVLLNHFSKFQGRKILDFWRILNFFSQILEKSLKIQESFPHHGTSRSDSELPKEDLFQFPSESENIFWRAFSRSRR